MPHKPTPKLDVWRTLSCGQRVHAGTLAQNRQGAFFQYHSDYLQNYGNLSPFKLKANTSLQAAPITPHQGLHGVFSDSLPDGWGRLLQDRTFRPSILRYIYTRQTQHNRYISHALRCNSRYACEGK